MRPWYVYVVWVGMIPAQSLGRCELSRDTALYDFVLSNDVTILLLLLAKCKSVFHGFYTAVPGSMVQPYFSASASPAAIPDGPAVTVLERAPERSEGEPFGRVRTLDGPQDGQGPQAA